MISLMSFICFRFFLFARFLYMFLKSLIVVHLWHLHRQIIQMRTQGIQSMSRNERLYKVYIYLYLSFLVLCSLLQKKVKLFKRYNNNNNKNCLISIYTFQIDEYCFVKWKWVIWDRPLVFFFFCVIYWMIALRAEHLVEPLDGWILIFFIASFDAIFVVLWNELTSLSSASMSLSMWNEKKKKIDSKTISIVWNLNWSGINSNITKHELKIKWFRDLCLCLFSFLPSLFLSFSFYFIHLYTTTKAQPQNIQCSQNT